MMLVKGDNILHGSKAPKIRGMYFLIQKSEGSSIKSSYSLSFIYSPSKN